jgi:hypothetical protein
VTEQPAEREPQAEPRSEAQREAEWQRRRRLADVFGDGLPETTSDERDPAERRPDREPSSETWLKEQVPPHHGG